MSGIEVAGLVLGALPILLGAVDSYKRGLGRAKVIFQRRKYVEKLGRAILSQQQILEEIILAVVRESGCDEYLRLRDSPTELLNDEGVQEQILEYLGQKNYEILIVTLRESCNIIKNISMNIAGLSPAFKGSTDDLLGFIKANHDADDKRWDLVARVKLMFGLDALKEAVQDLDDTTNRLSHFMTLVLSNRQDTDIGRASKKSARLARALRHVNTYAESRYFAILQSWRDDCHSKHEARLLLEDRVDAASTLLRKIGSDTLSPILAFQLIFIASMESKQVLWYETAVHVFSKTSDDVLHSSIDITISRSSPTIFIDSPYEVEERPNVTISKDICGTIETARCDKLQIAFSLTRNQEIGISPAVEQKPDRYQQAETITLKSLLSPGKLPLRGRMLLALRLASNLLQLLQTQWLQSAWSKDMVCFLLRPVDKLHNTLCQDQVYVDVAQPFVSLTFHDNSPAAKHQRSVEPKVVLLELGIMLLEIWHEITLETRFCLEKAPEGYYQRLSLAVEWLDDMKNPLPDLYNSAVTNCIRRFIGSELSFSKWEDIGLWNAVCEYIIEPLSRNCKQWHKLT